MNHFVSCVNENVQKKTFVTYFTTQPVNLAKIRFGALRADGLKFNHLQLSWSGEYHQSSLPKPARICRTNTNVNRRNVSTVAGALGRFRINVILEAKEWDYFVQKQCG